MAVSVPSPQRSILARDGQWRIRHAGFALCRDPEAGMAGIPAAIKLEAGGRGRCLRKSRQAGQHLCRETAIPASPRRAGPRLYLFVRDLSQRMADLLCQGADETLFQCSPPNTVVCWGNFRFNSRSCAALMLALKLTLADRTQDGADVVGVAAWACTTRAPRHLSWKVSRQGLPHRALGSAPDRRGPWWAASSAADRSGIRSSPPINKRVEKLVRFNAHQW